MSGNQTAADQMAQASGQHREPVAREQILKDIQRRIKMWVAEDSFTLRKQQRQQHEVTSLKSSKDDSEGDGQQTEAKKDKKRQRDEEVEEEEEEEEEDEEEQEEDEDQRVGHTISFVLAGFAGTRAGCQTWATLWESLDIDVDSAGFGYSEPEDEDDADVYEAWSEKEVAAKYPFLLTISIARDGQSTGFIYDAMELPSAVFERDFAGLKLDESLVRMKAVGRRGESVTSHFSGSGAEIPTDENELLDALFGVDSTFNVFRLPGLLRLGIYYDDEATLSFGIADFIDQNSRWNSFSSSSSSSSASPSSPVTWCVSDSDGTLTDADRNILSRGFEVLDISAQSSLSSAATAAATACASVPAAASSVSVKSTTEVVTSSAKKRSKH